MLSGGIGLLWTAQARVEETAGAARWENTGNSDVFVGARSISRRVQSNSQRSKNDREAFPRKYTLGRQPVVVEKTILRPTLTLTLGSQPYIVRMV